MEREILKLFEYLESFLLRNKKEVCFLFQGAFEEKRLALTIGPFRSKMVLWLTNCLTEMAHDGVGL
jgi:hypothetical protein